MGPLPHTESHYDSIIPLMADGGVTVDISLHSQLYNSLAESKESLALEKFFVKKNAL